MLIPLADLNRQFTLNISGVLHVGAHLGEEAEAYAQHGITNVAWVEGNPDLWPELERIIGRYRGQYLIPSLVSDKDDEEVTFHITCDPEGTAMSSSILELELHKKHAPWVKEVAQMTLPTKTVDTLVRLHHVEDCNFMNLDLQGAELLALHGAQTYLKTCDYIYTEVNTNYLYKDCALLPEMDQFLGACGFVRKAISMTKAEWGDAFYIRTA